MAYSNLEVNEVWVVEVKSHLREEGIAQMLRILHDFRRCFPLHSGRQVFGILAVVSATEEVKRQVLESGLHFACIQDELFALEVPEGFQAWSF